MKYAPKLYAKAFAACAAQARNSTEETRLIQGLLASIRKHGDLNQRGKIVRAAERLLRAKSGRRLVRLDSARPLSEKLEKSLRGLFGKDDTIETALLPELVGGVKITVDGRSQFDGSLKQKLDKLFT